MIRNILLVGLGGGLGSIARYLCQRWFALYYPHHFPWGTFVVNITGCLLIGIFWGLTFKSFTSNEHWKLFLMTGICGGFTTFSAFTLEGVGLLREQKTGLFFSLCGGQYSARIISYLGWYEIGTLDCIYAGGIKAFMVFSCFVSRNDGFMVHQV